jgi:hypothetical protein
MIRHLLDTLKNCVKATLLSPLLNLFFGPTIPNDTHPANTSMPVNIPENILAFRTITTLLANIPCTTPSIPTDNLQDPTWQNKQTRQELKICDAFAQLAVSQHDVVAVSTIRGWGLDLVTCAGQGQGQDQDQDTTQTAAQSSSLLGQIVDFARNGWQILVTRNDCFADPATSSGDYPTIISAQMPEDLNGQSAYDYMKSLVQTLW